MGGKLNSSAVKCPDCFRHFTSIFYYPESYFFKYRYVKEDNAKKMGAPSGQ